MRHPLELSPEEKIKIWLDLCDFTYRLMKNGLGNKQLEKRLHFMREADIKGHATFLTNLGKIDQ